MTFKKWTIFLVSYLFLFLAFFSQWQKLPDGKFHLVVFDVPVGDAFLIETPLGHTFIIDGGSDASVIPKIFDEKNFFTRKIDLLIVTHPHNDHLNGAYAVLQNFEVETILITGVETKNLVFEDFLRIAQQKKVPIIFADATKNIQTEKQGIIAKADSLGSLEALLVLLKQNNIPVVKAGIGNINKTDIISAKANLEINKLDAIIVGFNINENER